MNNWMKGVLAIVLAAVLTAMVLGIPSVAEDAVAAIVLRGIQPSIEKQAETDAKQAETDSELAKAIAELTALHVKAEAKAEGVEEGRAMAFASLCEDGTLDASDARCSQ